MMLSQAFTEPTANITVDQAASTPGRPGTSPSSTARAIRYGCAASSTIHTLPSSAREHLARAAGRSLCAAPPAGADRVDQAGGGGRGEHRTALGGGADGGEQLVARRVLEEVAGRARFDRGQGVGVGVVRGEDQ